jgi:hypothetical protein
VPGREPSLGELADDIHEMQRDLRSLRDVLERTYVRQDVYEAQSVTRDGRIAAIEDTLKWVARVAVSSLLLPLLVALAAYLLIGGPR